MAKAIDISLEVTQVATAYTGRDVRQAIVDALNATQNAINEMNLRPLSYRQRRHWPQRL